MCKVDSPCINQCALNHENVCLGCFRSLDEIAQWGEASELQKIKIVALSHDRQKNVNSKVNNTF